MQKSQLRVSLVIPVYNEESYLRSCLQAAVNQQMPFAEIIVVDNNSTDASAAIAASFPEVTVVHEPQQGKVHARTRGLNTATGDIIARIDADTLLPANWTTTLLQSFALPEVAAVSGRPNYYDLALPRLCNAVENFLRRRLAYALRDMLFLQGANMAIRREAWAAVRDKLCSARRDIHEDFDIGIHLQQLGYAVRYDPNLVAGLSARAVDVGPLFFLGYVLMNSHTYHVHQVPHYRRMYLVQAVVLLLFVPARVMFRARHPHTGKFSFAYLFTPRGVNARVAATDGVYLS